MIPKKKQIAQIHCISQQHKWYIYTLCLRTTHLAQIQTVPPQTNKAQIHTMHSKHGCTLCLLVTHIARIQTVSSYNTLPQSHTLTSKNTN